MSASDYAVKVRLFSVAEKDEEGAKSSVRQQGGAAICLMDFGHAKVRYRGLAKNARSGFTQLFALANILKCARAGRGEEFCSRLPTLWPDGGHKAAKPPKASLKAAFSTKNASKPA